MFKQRLITTLILTPIVLLSILYANYWVLITAISVITLACGWEWLQLIPVHTPIKKVIFLSLLIVASYLIHYQFKYWLVIGVIIWFAIAFCIYCYPKFTQQWGKKTIIVVWGLLLLPLFAQSLSAIYVSYGKGHIVYLLCVVWAADIGAYLAGKRFGHHKLIPAVSPGKTWEGFGGGVILAGFVALIGYFSMRPVHPSYWFLITFFIVVVTIVGDLFISMLKRRTCIKDTGSIIPGHGGILDRMDSLIAAAPFYYVLLALNY